jgi:hypothetical protein
LKQALERAASYYTSWPLKPGEHPRLPGYNADSAEGVDYVIDLTQPVGERIRDLTYQGKPLDPDQKLRVATNNYRYAGGGHYDVFKGLPIVYRSPQEIRDLIIEYVSRAGALPTDCDHNWKIVPPEAVEAMLQEAREREERRAVGAATRPNAAGQLSADTGKELTRRNDAVSFQRSQDFRALTRFGAGGTAARHGPWPSSRRKFSSPRASGSIGSGSPVLSWLCAMPASRPATSSASLPSFLRIVN